MKPFNWMILAILITVVVSLVGGHFMSETYSEVDIDSYEKPSGITGAFTIIGDSITFLWDLGTFQLEGVPNVLAYLFNTIFFLITFGSILFVVRGTD